MSGHYEAYPLSSTSMRPERRPLDHLSYLKSSSGEFSPSTTSSRYGSRAKSYARQDPHGSVEVRTETPKESNCQKHFRGRIEFWEEKEQVGFQEWQPDDKGPSKKPKRLPEHLEDIITSATLLAIWSDLEHDVLIPLTFNDACERDKLYRRLRSRIVFHDYEGFHGSERQQAQEQARESAYYILSKLKQDQGRKYLQELSIALSHFSAPFTSFPDHDSDTSNQLSQLVTQEQLIESFRAHDASQNTFITLRVERNFATGMLALTRMGAHSSLHIRDLAEHLPRDIRGFTKGIHLWLSDQVTRSSRNVFQKLKSSIPAREPIDQRILQPKVAQELIRDENSEVDVPDLGTKQVFSNEHAESESQIGNPILIESDHDEILDESIVGGIQIQDYGQSRAAGQIIPADKIEEAEF